MSVCYETTWNINDIVWYAQDKEASFEQGDVPPAAPYAPKKIWTGSARRIVDDENNLLITILAHRPDNGL